MSVLADHQIVGLAAMKRMIEPYETVAQTIKTSLFKDDEKAISWGPSSYGYDARLAHEFKLFRPPYGAVVDPKKNDPSWYETYEALDYFDLPPRGYVLARTIESFIIPKDVLVLCIGKSTYARVGILNNVTPLEPEWRGELTIEIANLLDWPVRLYVGEGFCQMIFLRGETPCHFTYETKPGNGKYQDQKGVVTVRI